MSGAIATSLDEVLATWHARYGADSLMDLRAQKTPFAVHGMRVSAGAITVDRADWVLVEGGDPRTLAEGARRATRALLCVLPNARGLAVTPASRVEGDLKAAVPALWRVGRVREHALFGQSLFPSDLPLPRVVADRVARFRAFFVDLTPRPTQAKRRSLVQAAS